ncbi:MAG: hypothetical protein Q7R93_02070 [bacterium]|nr:hypothetical protein [bacterium]
MVLEALRSLKLASFRDKGDLDALDSGQLGMLEETFEEGRRAGMIEARLNELKNQKRAKRLQKRKMTKV